MSWKSRRLDLLWNCGVSDIGVCIVAAFSPVAKLCATAGDESIRLWDSHSATQIAQFEAHQTHSQKGPGEWLSVTGMEFVNGGKTLVTAGGDGNIFFWEIPSCKLIGELSEEFVILPFLPRKSRLEWNGVFPLGVSHLAVSADGKTVARASTDNVRLWNLETRNRIAEFGGKMEIERISVDELVPGTERDRSDDWKRTFLHKWLHFSEAASNRVTHLSRVKSMGGRIDALGFSPDSRLLGYSKDGETIVVAWESGKQVLRCTQATCFSFSWDNSKIATCHPLGRIVLWDRNNGEQTRSIETRASRVVFAPDGQSLFIGVADQIQRINIVTGDQMQVMDGHSSNTWIDQIIIDSTGSLLGGVWAERTSLFRLALLRKHL